MSVELAWAAGFFDGEGTIGLYHHKRDGSYGVQVAITQTNPRVLLWIHEVFGGSLVHGVNKDHGYDYDFYELTWRGVDKAGVFIKRILPYLREKREQAELFLTYDSETDDDARAQIAAGLKAMKGRNRFKDGTIEHQTSLPGGIRDGELH